MSRRRATIGTKAISVTMKESTLHELNALLTEKQSRSKFISQCVELRLGVDKYVQDASTKQLMLALRMRDDCDPFLHKLISQVLDLDSLV